MTAPNDDAGPIADRAVSLWERLRDRGRPRSAGASDPASVERRLERWCQVVAKGDATALERRLAWDGVTLDEARAALGAAERPAVPPPWQEVFGELILSVADYRRHTPASVVREPDRPRPFADLLFPIVHGAKRRHLRQIAADGHDAGGLPRGLFGERARAAFDTGLLDRLCQIVAPCLQAQFAAFRPAGHALLSSLVGGAGASGTRHYREFVAALLSADLVPLFAEYPALARLVALTVENWVAHYVEFENRLRRDLALIREYFRPASTGSLGEVVALRFALSDSHRGGRSVIGLTFSSGLKLAYKPKPLGMDVAFNGVLDWCNRQGTGLDLRTVRILERPGYGWMEWLEQRPCARPEDAGKFYRRAGMLLALLHALRGTDCHHENLIACGEHPVFVDGETLMVPELAAAGEAPRRMSDDAFWQSVIRTGMLPRWEVRADTSVPYDISALGGCGPQETPVGVQQWSRINTDDMEMHYAPVTLPPRANGATLGETVLSPGDYVEDLVDGFTEMYRLLARQRTALRAGGGPLDAFRSHTVRWVFRPTEQYGQILRRSLAPDFLRDGRDRSIEIDSLSRGFVIAPDAADALVLLGPERQALEQLDIPTFEVPADDTTLSHAGQVVAPRFFANSGYSDVLSRLDSMSEADLAWQARIVEASLHASRARVVGTTDDDGGVRRSPSRACGEAAESERRVRFLAAANAIADEIASSAAWNPDGSVTWSGLTLLPGTERYQLLPVYDGLYAGRAGIALFLAACDHLNRSDAHRPLIDGALQPVRAVLRASDPSHLREYIRGAGIGAADGVGGLVYVLTSLRAWGQGHAAEDDAEALARAISPEAIAADRQLDVIGGAAGAILGLTKLYAARPAAAILEILQACGDWLCRRQLPDGEHAGGWETPNAARPLAGFAHGASGIAFALVRLHAVTREGRFLAAARAAVEFERAAFLPEAGNWIDFRSPEPGAPPSSATGWCHGAPGIGLARLTMSSGLSHPLVASDLEAALATTRAPRPHAADQICCGSFGRVDIMLNAARDLGRSDLSADAEAQAWDILGRPGGFRVTPEAVPGCSNPGCFDGLAGVGYVLLRLAAPGVFPSILGFE